MDNLFLVKFGEKKHLMDLIEGKLYCSPAEKYIVQERELHEKGQGDLLEGKFVIHALNFSATSYENGETYSCNHKTNFVVNIPDITKMPLFCMTKGTKEDCSEFLNEKEYVIKYAQDVEEEIKKSFPKADSALIILNPKSFIADIENTIGHEIYTDEIRYFDYSLEGFDVNMINYLTNTNILENGAKAVINFTYENRYRHLFCKDISFVNQKEYRIAILDDEISESHKYTIKFDTDYLLVSMDDLFRGVRVKA